MLAGGVEEIQQRSRKIIGLVLRHRQFSEDNRLSSDRGGSLGSLNSSHHHWRQVAHQNHLHSGFRFGLDGFPEESPHPESVAAADTAHRTEPGQKRRNVMDPVQRVLHIRALAARAICDRFVSSPGKQRFVG